MFSPPALTLSSFASRCPPQVCTACLGAFAHGANDVANAAGPLAAVYAAYACACAPAAPPLPAWTLALGGAGVAAGLGAAGGRVLRVLGPKMTRLSHARGLCVESAAAAVVLLGSCMGLPLSTTHCMWGAVTGLGLLEGAKGFNHRIVLKIFLSWVATVAAVGLTAAAFAAQGMWAPNRAASDREAAQGAAVGAAAAALAGALAGRQPGELPGGAGGAAQQAPLQALQAAVGMVLADPTCAWE
jgi:sodium-dependent phosphate transporter